MRRPFASMTPTTMPMPKFSEPMRSARILWISASDNIGESAGACANAAVRSSVRLNAEKKAEPKVILLLITLNFIRFFARQLAVVRHVKIINRGVMRARFFAFVRFVAAGGGSLPTLGRQPLDARNLFHDAVALVIRRDQQEPWDRIRIGRRIGDGPSFHAASVGPLPGGPREVRSNLLSGCIEELGIRPAERPAGTIAGIHLISLGMRLQHQLFGGRRFEVIRNGRRTLRGHADTSKDDGGKKESHTNQCVTPSSTSGSSRPGRAVSARGPPEKAYPWDCEAGRRPVTNSHTQCSVPIDPAIWSAARFDYPALLATWPRASSNLPR